jgi:hypothetical protein
MRIKTNPLWQLVMEGGGVKTKRGWALSATQTVDANGQPTVANVLIGHPPTRLTSRKQSVGKVYGKSEKENAANDEFIEKCPEQGFIDEIHIFHTNSKDDHGRIWGFKFKCSYAIPDQENNADYRVVWKYACHSQEPDVATTTKYKRVFGFDDLAVDARDDILAMWFGENEQGDERLGRSFDGKGKGTLLSKKSGSVAIGFTGKCHNPEGKEKVKFAFLRNLGIVTSEMLQE